MIFTSLRQSITDVSRLQPRQLKATLLSLFNSLRQSTSECTQRLTEAAHIILPGQVKSDRFPPLNFENKQIAHVWRSVSQRIFYRFSICKRFWKCPCMAFDLIKKNFTHTQNCDCHIGLKTLICEN